MRRDTKSKRCATGVVQESAFDADCFRDMQHVHGTLAEATAAGYCNKLIKQHKGPAVKLRLGL